MCFSSNLVCFDITLHMPTVCCFFNFILLLRFPPSTVIRWVRLFLFFLFNLLPAIYLIVLFCLFAYLLDSLIIMISLSAIDFFCLFVSFKLLCFSLLIKLSIRLFSTIACWPLAFHHHCRFIYLFILAHISFKTYTLNMPFLSKLGQHSW